MQTYIVSENGTTGGDGSEGRPFASLERASAVANPGDQVLVRGTLRNPVKWGKDGTGGAPITIAPHPDGGRIDGGYMLPAGKAQFVGPTGLERVDKALVLIAASNVEWTVDVGRSRGRGIQIGDGKKRVGGSTVSGATLAGIRAAPIDIRGADGVIIFGNTTRDTGNYNTTVRDTTAYNVSGCIKTLDSTGVLIEDNDIEQHYGNVLSPSRLTVGITVRRNRIRDCAGSLIYSHFAQDVTIEENILWYSPDWTRIHDGIVINNEEEFTAEGSRPGQIRILRNLIMGVRNGIAVWANEGADVVTDGIEVEGNIVINAVEWALLVRDARKVRGMRVLRNVLSATNERLIDVRGGDGASIYFADNGYSREVPAFARHAGDWAAPTVAELRAINVEEVSAFAARLGKPAPEPVDPLIDQDELRAWLKETETMPAQLEAWLARGRALVG